MKLGRNRHLTAILASLLAVVLLSSCQPGPPSNDGGGSSSAQKGSVCNPPKCGDAAYTLVWVYSTKPNGYRIGTIYNGLAGGAGTSLPFDACSDDPADHKVNSGLKWCTASAKPKAPKPTQPPSPYIDALVDWAALTQGNTATIRVLANDKAFRTNIVPSKTVIVDRPDHATATVRTDGTVTYTPTASFYGKDTFTYKACDARGRCDTAPVIVAVDPKPAVVAADDTATTGQGKRVAVSVLSNDTATHTTIAVDKTAVERKATHGRTKVERDGTVTYTPDSAFSGADTFTYKACNRNGVCDTATVTITVTATVTPPGGPEPSANVDTVIIEANAFQYAQQDANQTIRLLPITRLTCNNKKASVCGGPPAAAPTSGTISGLGAGPYLTGTRITEFTLTPPKGYSAPADYQQISSPIGQTLDKARDFVFKFTKATPSGVAYQYTAKVAVTYELRPWTWKAGTSAPVWGTPTTRTITVTLASAGCHPVGCKFGVLGNNNT